MKRTTAIYQIFILLIVFLRLSQYPVWSQDTTRHWQRPNALKTNLLAPPSFFYERALTRRFALRLSARYWAFGIVAKDTRFANATVEGKIYTARFACLQKQALPAGFFVNPYLKARIIRYVNQIGQGVDKGMALDEVKARSIGFGLTIGYRWVLPRGFVLEIQHGGGMQPAALTHYWHTMRYGSVTS